MMADMETKLNAARLLTYNAAYCRTPADGDRPLHGQVLPAEAAIEIVNKSLKLPRGYGYSASTRSSASTRRRVCSIYEALPGPADGHLRQL
jgi:alkylation response protein AidB-like acyl-CoA dehydrogenase